MWDLGAVYLLSLSSCNVMLSIYSILSWRAFRCLACRRTTLVTCLGADIDRCERRCVRRGQFGSRIRPRPSRCARHCSFSAAPSIALHNVDQPRSNIPRRLRVLQRPSASHSSATFLSVDTSPNYTSPTAPSFVSISHSSRPGCYSL